MHKTFVCQRPLWWLWPVLVGFGLAFSMASVGAQSLPAQGQVEVAFSPDGGGERLVLKVIGSATSDISVLAYSFTSPAITRALLDAHKRGVRVSMVVDEKSNLSGDGSNKSRAALSALANAGVVVRVCDAFAIHHDKVLVVDRAHVQTGSFNYSTSAQTRNSENVLVQWNNPPLAALYLKHFERNAKLSKVFNPL